ncbi:protein SMAX1-LIKE 8-like [Pistacia vera]|uniref:protein SMAX1-LIKE 8-like n=1 Tax=Pistacia vera TaxID=55513 RepID=UPI00126392C7|nr:protein SMAX1-LIKE 8-like [Pistacia vera]
MPTPVSVARQCLTSEAAHALDEAVAVARRRGHGQTTSLHAVSALLSFPSSILREACARARNAAYSPRLQFKALDLCLSVSLDRVSSTQLSDDPPVSNSLMAAIKRSQANQRRQPDNFNLYHQLSQSHNSSVAVVKVELQHLVISILDDPVVSRVFSEAGFRSNEIKYAILRPLTTQLFKLSRASKAPPPIFLCNYLTENSDPVSGRKGMSYTFPGYGGYLDHGDDNCKRIGDVLLKRKNPMLVGVYAYGALKSFNENVERKHNKNILPSELSGLNIISIENDVSKFITENTDKGSVNVRFVEVSLFIEQSLGPGVVVNYGDLKAFVNENSYDKGTNDAVVSHVVAQLTKLLHLRGAKVWLIGAAANYETYLKLLNRFPSIEKDWDLHLLPIASLKASSMAETFPKSSLMESFVPFAGLFSTPSDLKSPLSGVYQCATRCHQCNERCEQEMIALSKDFSSSIADQCQSSLPSWLQMTERGKDRLNRKTKDGGTVLSAKITEVQKKWDDICQHHHPTQPYPSSNIYQVGSQFPTAVGFQFPEDRRENADNSNRNTPPSDKSCINVNSVIPIDSENVSASKTFSSPMVSKDPNEILVSKLWQKPSKTDLESGGLRSPCSLSNSSVDDSNRTSPTSVTSVTTVLGLGMCSAPAKNELKELTEVSQELSGCFSANVDFVNGSISNHPAQSSSSSCPDWHRQFDLSNCKTLFSALTERVGWQDEAIHVLCKNIVHWQALNENCHRASKRGVWFNFTGPDRCSKRKIAVALAEIIYGSKENFIGVDLSSNVGVTDRNAIFDCEDVNGYGMKFRGKNGVDYIAGELCKRPLSIFFLENVDKADLQVQISLSKAIRTGRFIDSDGRETCIKNTIFVTTSAFMKDSKNISYTNEGINYSEERILRAKSRQMQILFEPAPGKSSISQKSTTSSSSEGMVFVNKRKLKGRNEYSQQDDISEMVKRAHRSSAKNLDLNLPAEENELQEIKDGNSDNDSSGNSKPWLQDIFDQTETVVFKPFDFDALAEKVLNDINKSFHMIVGSECSLEIDTKVMEQLLAAAYLSDTDSLVTDWLEKVLCRGFLEVPIRYNLTAHSIVKLVTCEEHSMEEPTPEAAEIRLPSTIILN